MAGYQAISGINSYGSGYNNYQHYAQPQVAQYRTNDSAQKINAMASYSPANNYPVEDKTVEDNKKKRLNTALWITGSLLVTGAAAAILFASKGTGNNLWEKCKNGVKNAFSSKGASEETGEAVLDTVEMIQKNGKTTLRLPGATQTLKGKVREITSAASDLGIDSVAKEITEASSKVKTSTMTITHNGTKTFVTLGNSGKVFCKGADGKMLKLADQPADYQKLVNETIDAIKEKKLGKISSNVKIQNLVYDSKLANGTTGTYLRKGGVFTGTSEIKRIVTDRFDVGSQKVLALMNDNKKLATAVEEATQEGRRWLLLGKKIKPDYSNWNVRSATHSPTVKGWPSSAQIMVENNKITGIIENGQVFDAASDRYKELHYKFPKAFKKVLDKKLDNVVRYL